MIGLVALVQSRDSFDRSAAVARVIDSGGGRLDDAEAQCYVDGVHHQLGGRYLQPDASIPDDVAARMTSIRVDCIGVTNLGVTTTVDPAASDPSGSATAATESGNLPRKRGDDATLDALYDQCAAGSGQACDDLFNRSPVGSDYEAFAITCGGRTTERSCAAVYLLPESTTVPPPVAPAITGPPAPPTP